MKKLNKDTHWQEVRVKGAAINYVMKEDTRVDGPWEFGTKPICKNNKQSVKDAQTARAARN